MKETNTTMVEQALVMYKETVSPSKDTLTNVLNQIPEKELVERNRRVIRSPYIWLALKRYAPVFIIALVLFPSVDFYLEDPFYTIDKSVEAFEIKIDTADYKNSLTDYADL